MYFTKIALVASGLALFSSVVADDIELDNDDIPQQCALVCQPVKALADACEVADDTGMTDLQENQLERQCFCLNTSFNVASRTADCAACMNANVRERDDMEDINFIMAACGFPSAAATGAGGASSTGIGVVPTQTQPVSVTAVRPTNIAQLTATVQPNVVRPGEQVTQQPGQNPTGAAAGLIPVVAGVYCAALVAAGAMLFA